MLKLAKIYKINNSMLKKTACFFNEGSDRTYAYIFREDCTEGFDLCRVFVVVGITRPVADPVYASKNNSLVQNKLLKNKQFKVNTDILYVNITVYPVAFFNFAFLTQTVVFTQTSCTQNLESNRRKFGLGNAHTNAHTHSLQRKQG